MKFLMTLTTVVLMASCALAAALPDIPTLHHECNQNAVCDSRLYCRISGNPVYGTCEDPLHV